MDIWYVLIYDIWAEIITFKHKKSNKSYTIEMKQCKLSFAKTIINRITSRRIQSSMKSTNIHWRQQITIYMHKLILTSLNNQLWTKNVTSKGNSLLN